MFCPAASTFFRTYSCATLPKVTTEAGTVLVIDDHPANLEAMAEALTPLGYEVWQALDGETGLALARERQPDVILLDVVMPGMDGYEVCQRLKNDDETRLLPVVFLTGLDSREARLQGLECGATDFLTKPFDLVELEARVHNLVNFRRLTQDLDSAELTLLALARAVEQRDGTTGDHCGRLSAMAVQLGEDLGLSSDELRALKRAGYLHDIGKIGIPDSILLKPGPLTPEEWTIMKSHVEIGVRICSPMRTIRNVLPIIRHHHERGDGSGYPDGLRNGQIPMLARVFQVVDIFDALTGDRPYRPGLPMNDAMAVLRREVMQGWWDGEIVERLSSLVDPEIDAHG